MKTQYDIVAVGECLVDLVCTERDGTLFLEGNPGGAPANVLALAARLGLSTALISKVGQDDFGAFLRGHMEKAGVGAAHLLQDAAHPTTLAFVKLDETGNRSFTFYRNHSADVMLREEELPAQAICTARVLHFGSVSLVREPARSATLCAAHMAREAGVTVSYDPNLRPPLWKSLDDAKSAIREGMALADLVKVSDEELVFLTGVPDPREGARLLLEQYPLRLLAVTMGPGGCLCVTRAGSFDSRAFDVPCVDTTGAGDAFWGATLSWLLRHNALQGTLSATQMEQLLDFANAAGSLTTTKKGAIPAMPDEAKILDCIEHSKRLPARL